MTGDIVFDGFVPDSHGVAASCLAMSTVLLRASSVCCLHPAWVTPSSCNMSVFTMRVVVRQLVQQLLG